MTTTPETRPSSTANALGYFKSNKTELLAIGGAALLGTTALATPLLATTMGAMALMAGSFYLLVKNSDIVVNNAKAMGERSGIPPLLVGLGLGAVTSMPEMLVSVQAALGGVAELAVGNIVGSNIANILLILGLTAAIAPITSKGLSWRYNTLAMAGATAIFAGAMIYGGIGAAAGIGMLAAMGAYMFGSYKAEKDDEITARAKGETPEQKTLPTTGLYGFPKWANVAYGAAGVGGLIAAAGLLVSSATVTATALGISPALVGTLAVAVGTSLPELAVNVKAALKGETEMAVGNILGSNIFNILAVGGAVSLLSSVSVPADFTPATGYGLLNLGAFTASAGLLTYALLKGKGALTRVQGVAGLGLYAAFTAASFFMSEAAPADKAAEMAPPARAAIVETVPAAQHSALIPGYTNQLKPL